jgi:hypothetical protein
VGHPVSARLHLRIWWHATIRIFSSSIVSMQKTA